MKFVKPVEMKGEKFIQWLGICLQILVLGYRICYWCLLWSNNDFHKLAVPNPCLKSCFMGLKPPRGLKWLPEYNRDAEICCVKRIRISDVVS